MGTREHLAGRMADAVVRRIVGRRLAEIRDESRVREAVQRILVENFQAEDRLEAEVRALMLDHAKQIKDSASDYRRVFSLVKAKLARDRGFTL